MFLKKPMILSLVFVLTSGPVFACLWDYDTLAMERKRFPDVLELIAGKFLRHSDAYYQWRIEDREKRIADGDQSVATQDDLAVAYEKTGNHKKAIEIAKQQLAENPNRYETHANLGTFLIHDGQLEKGLEHIKRAIEINPDAHFGREKIQRYLVEYVISKKTDGKLPLPMNQGESSMRGHAVGFATFVLEKENAIDDYKKRDKPTREAIKGVAGMMRFGNFDSPVLLEAMGDLLYNDYSQDDAKRLAARAYLKASYEVEDEEAKAAYRKKAQSSLNMQTVSKNSEAELQLSQLEKTFKSELKEAEAWYQKLVDDEAEWIKNGKNLDKEFDKKYYQSPMMYRDDSIRKTKNWPIVLGIGIGIVLLGSILAWRFVQSKG